MNRNIRLRPASIVATAVALVLAQQAVAQEEPTALGEITVTARKRAEEQYSYDVQLQRKKDQDAFQEHLRQQAAAERDRKEKLEKDWAAREDALKLREKAGGVTVGQGAAWSDPRVFLAGYGPQASTIGANRAGRMIARQIMAML